MSVISKMVLKGVLDFPSGAISKLSCVCENDLMAAYAKADEDRCFTKYSPWGVMQLGHSLRSFPDEKAFYVVALGPDDKGKCEGAAHIHPFRVASVTHYGGESAQVEACHDGCGQSARNLDPDTVPIGALNWRMSIDNPPAVAFFRPGQSGYRVALYDAERFTIETALADAHA
jgi:hypothetical protein